MVIVEKILYPTDFSDHSLCALAYALNLQRKFQDAELHCLHIVDESIQDFWRYGFYETRPSLPENLMAEVEHYMANFVAEHLSQAPDLVTKVVSGQPCEEILRYAGEEKVDMIIMATHVHSAFSSALLGSTAEKVVRKASCPVMTIKHPDNQFAMA
jgi:nucleotide-binding universal stress UspA family protein